MKYFWLLLFLPCISFANNDGDRSVKQMLAEQALEANAYNNIFLRAMDKYSRTKAVIVAQKCRTSEGKIKVIHDCTVKDASGNKCQLTESGKYTACVEHNYDSAYSNVGYCYKEKVTARDFLFECVDRSNRQTSALFKLSVN